MIRGSGKTNHQQVLVVSVLEEARKVVENGSVSFVENHNTLFIFRFNLSCGRVNDTLIPIQTTCTGELNHSLVGLVVTLHQPFILKDYIDLMASELQQGNG
jgi:hypothetical protein